MARYCVYRNNTSIQKLHCLLTEIRFKLSSPINDMFQHDFQWRIKVFKITHCRQKKMVSPAAPRTACSTIRIGTITSLGWRVSRKLTTRLRSPISIPTHEQERRCDHFLKFARLSHQNFFHAMLWLYSPWMESAYKPRFAKTDQCKLACTVFFSIK